MVPAFGLPDFAPAREVAESLADGCGVPELDGMGGGDIVSGFTSGSLGCSFFIAAADVEADDFLAGCAGGGDGFAEGAS